MQDSHSIAKETTSVRLLPNQCLRTNVPALAKLALLQHPGHRQNTTI